MWDFKSKFDNIHSIKRFCKYRLHNHNGRRQLDVFAWRLRELLKLGSATSNPTSMAFCHQYFPSSEKLFHVIMMTSSNRNIFRVTGSLWRESTGHQWIPHKGPVTRALMSGVSLVAKSFWHNDDVIITSSVRVTVYLLRWSRVTGGFPSRGVSDTKLWYFPLFQPEGNVEQKGELPVIWNSMTAMWRNSNGYTD